MELALAMPVLCLLLLAVVQFAVVVRNQLVAIEAARSGARAAAVASNPSQAAAVAVASAGGDSPPVHVSTASDGTYVTVTVTITDPTDIPMIGILLPDVTVRSSSTMILEPP